jgi:hypothetical protein
MLNGNKEKIESESERYSRELKEHESELLKTIEDMKEKFKNC